MLELWQKGHRHLKCTKTLRPSVIAERKAEIYQKKRNIGNGSKRVLLETVQGLGEIMDIEDYEEQYATENTCFGDAEDTESYVGDQSSSSDDPNEFNLSDEFSHAIVPQTEDSDLDF